MRKVILVLLLLCSVQFAYAAFPISYQKIQAVDTANSTKTKPAHPGWLRVKRTPFTALSAFGFLSLILAVVAIEFLVAWGILFSLDSWLILANYISGFSVVAAILGNLFGEGHLARIMLFCSIFFFLIVLIFV